MCVGVGAGGEVMMLFKFIIVFIFFWFLYSAREIHLCQNTLLLSDICY